MFLFNKVCISKIKLLLGFKKKNDIYCFFIFCGRKLN